MEIYIIPPDENDGAATDEDSGEEDATDFNMNWLMVQNGLTVKMKCER